MRMSVENSVVKLAAAAMRAGVFHQHVVIHVLAPIADKQPVDQALAALAPQHRVHVVAHQRAAQQHGVRAYIGASRLLHAKCGNVEGLQVFAFDQVMGKHSVFTCGQLSNDVGEKSATPQRDVIFDDAGLGFVFGHDQAVRMRHGRTPIRSGDEQQMNRRFEHCAARQIDVSAILDEGCIEGREPVAPEIDITAQVRFEGSRIPRDLVCQATHLHPRRQRAEVG